MGGAQKLVEVMSKEFLMVQGHEIANLPNTWGHSLGGNGPVS